MSNKRKFFQLNLLLKGLCIIFFTYFSNYEKDKNLVKGKKGKDIQEKVLEDEINKFENVEYSGIDNSGNKFVINSEYAQFEEERPEIIRMEEVECFFYFKDNTFLKIIADNGIFNNITNDMEFADNVKMDYLENTLFSDRAIFNNYENQLLVAGNVKGKSPQTDLQADKLDFDLSTKNLKISMYNKKRVNIKTRF